MNLIIILSILLHSIESLRILFYVIPFGKSHLDFADTLIDLLANRGHHVDLVIARINANVVGNGTSQARRVYQVNMPKNIDWSRRNHLVDPFGLPPYGFGSFRKSFEPINALCEEAVSDDNLVEFMKSGDYDLGVFNAFDYCGLYLFAISEIPSIASISALPLMSRDSVTTGIPNPPSTFYPMFQPRKLDSILDRVQNLINWAYIHWIEIPETIEAQENIFARRKRVQIGDLLERVDVMFVNSHAVIERPSLLTGKLRYIGGINRKTPGVIRDPKFVKVLSRPSNGVVIFSFGTQIHANVFPTQVISNFVQVFRALSQFTFIWKFDGNYLKTMNVSENVFVFDWIPQTDLLNDERVIGFITHSGLNSVHEAVYSATPMLTIPFFADQPHNAFSCEQRGISVMIHKNELTRKNIESGLQQILFNKTYLANARKVRKLLEEFPEQPSTTFINWIEYAANNRGVHKMLNLPSANKSIIEYYSLDIILIIAIVFCLSLYQFRIVLNKHIR